MGKAASIFLITPPHKTIGAVNKPRSPHILHGARDLPELWPTERQEPRFYPDFPIQLTGTRPVEPDLDVLSLAVWIEKKDLSDAASYSSRDWLRYPSDASPGFYPGCRSHFRCHSRGRARAAVEYWTMRQSCGPVSNGQDPRCCCCGCGAGWPSLALEGVCLHSAGQEEGAPGMAEQRPTKTTMVLGSKAQVVFC